MRNLKSPRPALFPRRQHDGATLSPRASSAGDDGVGLGYSLVEPQWVSPRQTAVSRAPLLRAWCLGLWRALPHLLILVGGYEVYRAIGIHAARQPALAHAHAAALFDAERRLGLALEASMQRAALHHGALLGTGLLDGGAVRHIGSMVYAGSQLHWLAAMLLWLYVFYRARFVFVRNVLVVSSLLAALFSALYAVAPPRFALAGPPYGVEDVMNPYRSELDLVRHTALNLYGSLPSSHVLWALVTGLGLCVAATTLGQRLLAAAFPAVMVPTVIITGNHYVLDCAGSAVLFAACVLAEVARASRSKRPVGSRRGIGGLVSRSPLEERRHKPDLRPLDRPLLLCATMGIVLVISSDPAQRAGGLGLLLCGAAMPPLSRYRIRHGRRLGTGASGADWWTGFLFVAGSTFVGAHDPAARLASVAIWLAAGVLPLAGRLRAPPSTDTSLSGQAEVRVVWA